MHPLASYVPLSVLSVDNDAKLLLFSFNSRSGPFNNSCCFAASVFGLMELTVFSNIRIITLEKSL